MSDLLEFKNFSLRLGRHRCQDIHLKVRAGETVALLGPSGSGKTLLGFSILRLPPTDEAVIDGQILWRGQDLTQMTTAEMESLRGSQIGFVFQEPQSSLNPVLTIEAQLTQGLKLQTDRLSSVQMTKKALALLSDVGLSEGDLRKYPHQLSGGQKQRVVIAMAIARGPQLLIADEPTTALDSVTQIQILRLLKELQQKYDMALLFITHDLQLARNWCDRTVYLREGRLSSAPHAGVSQPSEVKPSAPADLVPLMTVRDLNVVTADRRHVLLPPLSMTIYQGRTLAMVGLSGSGKTTLAKALLRLQPHQKGEMYLQDIDWGRLQGEDLRRERHLVQIVFQDPATSLNPKWSIQKLLAEALGLNGKEASPESILSLLQDVGLNKEHQTKYPHELSGGERQRVSLARALARSPRLLVLDEAFSALDPATRDQILELLSKLRRQRDLTLMMITHDMKLVKNFAEDLIVLDQGRIVESGVISQIWTSPRHAITRRLIEASSV